jgi:deazaflavin-dependent oxidoreductase (nitroreductase family)
MTTSPAPRYLPPSGADRLTSSLLRRLVAVGVPVWGARELRVRGRRSGETRRALVNLLEVDGQRYLVAPRGATEWARNLRAAGSCELRLGRRVEPFTVTELADSKKEPVLRTYLARFGFEVGRFFEGLDKRSTPAELMARAPGFPVFRLQPAAGTAAA